MDRRSFLGAMGTLALLTPALGLAKAVGSSARITGCTLEQGAGGSHLRLDLSDKVPYRVFTLASPARVVVDIDQVPPHLSTAHLNLSGSPIADMRSGPHGNGVRIVLDMRQPVQPQASMVAGARAGQQQLVVALPVAGTVAAAIAQRAAPKQRPAIVAIDPGHGGRDPGAVSASDHFEKVVALSIATKLHGLLAADSAFAPTLTRNSDHFIPLRERVLIAHQHKADLFVSIHADAAPPSAYSARGASVYVLSQHGATSAMARFMAESENSSDRYDSLRDSTLYTNNPALSKVLVDMSMDATIMSSLDLGRLMISDLSQVTRIHQQRVDQAAFAVLKSPDIPSILVETGFMSNPDDCKLLLTNGHQDALADSLRSGIHNFFRANPVMDTRAA